MSEGRLSKAVKSDQFVVTAECRPPQSAAPELLKKCAGAIGGMVDAVCASESEDGARLCSLAACNHLSSAGAEPVLHLLTRDMNRIALQSNILGAASMGVRNILCIAGRHQALTSSAAARGVFDIDPIQLLQIADSIRKDCKLADGTAIDSPVDLLLGTDTNPFADPTELQIMALERAAAAGADFVITQPVFNLKKFTEWMGLVRDRGIHSRVCIIASVMPISSASDAEQMREKYRYLDIPDDVVARMDATNDLAVETIKAIRSVEGVRGINLMTGDNFELAAEILEASGLSRS